MSNKMTELLFMAGESNRHLERINGSVGQHESRIRAVESLLPEVLLAKRIVYSLIGLIVLAVVGAWIGFVVGGQP